MATQIKLYNGALRLLGERTLSAIDEDRKPRHLLDDVWNDGLLKTVLEQGQWNFAMRAVQVDKSTTTIPTFGHEFAFPKPTDWVRTAGLCQDEHFRVPLLDYLEEIDFWFAEIDPIYVRYVSNDSNYGTDLTRWPETFTRYVETYLASEIAFSLTQDGGKHQMLLGLTHQRLIDARSKDAMNEATVFPPAGTWSNARTGYRNTSRDRGRRGQLIG